MPKWKVVERHHYDVYGRVVEPGEIIETNYSFVPDPRYAPIDEAAKRLCEDCGCGPLFPRSPGLEPAIPLTDGMIELAERCPNFCRPLNFRDSQHSALCQLGNSALSVSTGDLRPCRVLEQREGCPVLLRLFPGLQGPEPVAA